MLAMITTIQAVPAILAARAIIAILAITIAMVAMIAILLAMLAMTAILLAIASNDCQYCQLSAMCATTAINCPCGSLFTAALAHSFWHYCCSCSDLPSHPFLPADSKTAKQQNRKAEQPKASTDLHWKFSATNAKVCTSGLNWVHGLTVITLDSESIDSQFESW